MKSRMWVGCLGVFALIALGFSNVSAQEGGSISGKVVNGATMENIGGASVSLLNQQSRVTIGGLQTPDNGQISFSGIAPGTYAILITFVGFEDFIKENVRVTAGQSVELGTLTMTPSEEVLDAVVIQGTPPAMELGIDRKVFNVAQSTISVGGNASDLLANVPSLEVDMDGSVSLRGSSSVKILIDGKESAMAGSDVTQLLQALPANSIERVEVITNPSSRYDAEGQSGIINIVLKRNLRTGLNGSIDASAGSYNNYSTGVNLNYRDNRFNYQGSYSFNRRNNIGGGLNRTTLLQNNSITNNTTESERLGLNHRVRLGVDYYMGERTTWGVSGNLSLRGNERREDIFYTYLNHPALEGTSERTSVQDEDDLGFDLNMDFRHEFASSGELTANLGYGSDTEEGVNEFNQLFAQSALTDRRINNSSEDGRNFNIQFDYLKPLGENIQFEAGYRTNIRSTQDHQFSLTNQNGSMLPDYDVSNDFNLSNEQKYMRCTRSMPTINIGLASKWVFRWGYGQSRLISTHRTSPWTPTFLLVSAKPRVP